MATAKIKKGDMVMVIAGTEKGNKGKVLAVDTKKGTVVVEGLNMMTKHTKPNAANQNGGIVRQEGPINISNVMYLYKDVPVRIGFQGDKKDKVRVAKLGKGKVEVID